MAHGGHMNLGVDESECSCAAERAIA